ncbi:DUF6286 domain-containing protein [Streptomyces sp. NPDC059176]|uniref:DUF6286 domain-containing protein n=1 Tax=unclassified Streptomyces TaxID=2593676 RepID=UPI0036B5C6CB
MTEPAEEAEGPDRPASPAPPRGGGVTGRSGRFWSRRRVPAALLAAGVTGAAGLLLYDVAAVRTEHAGMHWRRWLADQLDRRPLDDGWLLVGAALAVLLGLVLIVLAVTPGLRTILPMRRDTDRADVRAGLDREAAALVLRDRGMEVSGVQSVRVRVRRSRATVRVVSHFRDLHDVRRDVHAVMGDGIRELGLARPPALSVHLRRPAKKG